METETRNKHPNSIINQVINKHCTIAIEKKKLLTIQIVQESETLYQSWINKTIR